MAETTTTEEAPQVQETPETAVQEAQPEEPQTTLGDPMLSQLWDDLGITGEEEPATEKKDEPEAVQPEENAERPEEPATEKPEDEAAETEEPAEAESEPKKEFSVKPKLDEEAFRKVVREELEARGKTPEPEPEPEVPTTDPYEEQLIDEQKQELDLYRYAESKGKHKGKASQLLDFYKELDKYVEKSKREDPERTFNSEDSEFMEYVRINKPSIRPADVESLKRDKFRDEIVSDVKKEYEQTINGLKGELNEIKATPQVRATIKEAGRAYDEFAKLDEMKEADPLKHSIFTQEREKYMAWADDFVKRWHGLNAEVDDGYYKLINDIDEAAQEYSRSGNTDKDGQKFLTPARYAQAQDKKGYWTWDQNDILEHFGTKAISLANKSVENRVKELESYGFVRGVQKGESKQSAKDDPQPVNPPKASRSPSPGAAEGASLDEDHIGKQIIDDLGINFG